MLGRLSQVEINLKHFSYNFSAVKKIVGPKVKIMAVVKANAYGHGVVEIAIEAERLGADYFGVVCLHEARELRQNNIRKPILVLNYTDADSLKNALELDITLNIMDEKVLKALDGLARKRNKVAKIHVKIDTGMHRLGLLPEKALQFIPIIENYKNISLEGIFTHSAVADEKSPSFTKKQLSVFGNCLEKLQKKDITAPLIHSANSAATLRFPDAHFDMVRPGIILYGMLPSDEFRLPFCPKPILTFKSKIAQIRKIEKGETVGYGRTFKASKTTLVATLPVGYGDGFRRSPKNWGYVLVRGKKARLLGRVSMDQSSIDVTNIPSVKAGDEVVLIGKQGKEKITAEDVAKHIGTINYEVTTSILNRVSRVYIRN